MAVAWTQDVTTALVEALDLGEFVAKVKDPSGLRVGMGVSIRNDARTRRWDVSVRTIVGIEGNSIRLDRRAAMITADYRSKSEL